MRTFPLIVALWLGVFQLHAQRELQNPLVDSKEVLEKGAALYQAGKYKEAIAEYARVPESDTSYSEILHELISSYYSDSNFVAAEKYSNIALKLYPHKNTEWYNLLANIYDDTKRSDMALKAYDTIIAQDPNNYICYFNKGISLLRRSDNEGATANFQQCIILNPYYSSAHYYLGLLSVQKGNLVEAMMSFACSLLVSPGNSHEKTTLSTLAAIAEVNSAVSEQLKNYQRGKQDNFDEIQEILVSKVALERNYKLKAQLEDKIVRQLQVLSEKLEFNAGDKGFWMQYYVPLFKMIWNERHFEPFVFYALSNLDIKQIKDYNRKEKKKIEAFSTAAIRYLDDIRLSHEVSFSKRPDTRERFLIENYLVIGKGAYGKNAKNEIIVEGPWKFYYKNGRLRSKGSFDNEGMRTGEWLFYYEDGVLKESTTYLNNLPNGKSQEWYDNGILYSTTTYVNDKEEGEVIANSYSGKLASVVRYSAGKRQGKAKYYNATGYEEITTSYNNDLQEGERTVYHANGKRSSVTKYIRDVPADEYKAYFDDGRLKESGNFSDGKKAGIWKSYFTDGRPEGIENYLRGELDGEWFYYHPNGMPSSKRVYKKGEIDGKAEEFDEDGVVFSETIMENGRLRDIRFFDKKGAVISNTTSRKGNTEISFYDAHGIRVSKGNYSKDGLAEGIVTYYFKNGNILSTSNYKNGMREGKRNHYYANNTISQEGNYKGNNADGYFINYHNNGKVSGEGWYVDDQRQGTFIDYDALGNITSRAYYLNDKIHGTSEYYTPSGRLDYKQYYDVGWLNKTEQYDSTGALIVSSRLEKGEGKVRYNLFNGKPYVESNYKFYQLNGVRDVSNGDGSKGSRSFYKHGQLDSSYTSWHPNGKVKVEGMYVGGNKTGTWKFNDYQGRPSETEHYKDGLLDGPDIQFDDSGEVQKESLYKGGELDGETRFYNGKNQLRLVLYYKSDNLRGYSYEDKSGNLVPMILLSKEAGIVDSYYKNGSKSAHMVFNEGVMDGEWVFYATNGKEQATGTRVNGLNNGSRKSYYPSGKVKTEDNYIYGDLHGLSRHYNEDGSLVSELNYYLDALHGDCRYYTAGKLNETYNYYYGELESKK